jgi:hypothetical protein
MNACCQPTLRLLITGALTVGMLPQSAVAAGEASGPGFAGAFVQGAAASVQSKTQITFTDWFSARPDARSGVGELGAGYGWDFGAFGLRASGFYMIGHQKGGTTRQDSPFVAAEIGDTASMTLKNTRGLVLEPGVRLGSSTLVVARLGYGWTHGEWAFVRPYWSDRYSGSSGYSGVLLGLGAHHAIGRDLYGYAQAQQIRYGGQNVQITVVDNGVSSSYIDRYKPTSTSFMLGIGTRF